MAKKPDYAAAMNFDDQNGQGAHPAALAAILKDEDTARVLMIPVANIEPDPNQPRKDFDETAHQEMTASIREVGVLQPIIVRRKPDFRDRFIIIAGERRWRGAVATPLLEIPALLRSPKDVLEIGIIENLQRQDLAPLEEAEALKRLKDAKGYTLGDLGRIIGKSKASMSETLKLLELPADIQAELRTRSDVRTIAKSQILQVLRAGDSQKIRAAWDALTRGELKTVRDLRTHTKRAAPAGRGRPPHYTFHHRPVGKPFHVTVTFSKKTASRAEVRGALKDTLKHLP